MSAFSKQLIPFFVHDALKFVQTSQHLHVPFLQLFRQTSAMLLALSSPPTDFPYVTHAQRLMVDIFYDFTCQDLPNAIEDAHDEFFAPGSGLFQRFLAWDPAELRGDVRSFRQAAADVLQALVSSGHESETTEIVSTWISTGLTEYNTNRSEN
jgi:hypothetical protein